MVEVKVGLSDYLQQLVDRVAEMSGQSRRATFIRLLYQIELLAKNSKLPDAIGLDFVEQIALLNGRGLGAKHLDPVHQGGGERVNFDVALLERSAKSKTGFAGVNATTGNTFRALVPDVESGTGSRYLASRPTALLAAIDRFEWFERWGIPYGNVGIRVEEIKKKHAEWTMEQCLTALLEFQDDREEQFLKNPITRAAVERTLARHREANGIERPLVVEDERPGPPSRPDVVMCKICEEEIVEGEPFGPIGKGDDFAHVGCIGS